MRFSLQMRYAVSGVFDLAYNGHGRAVQVRVIGDRQTIPMRYLEQIFQRLRKAGLVAGKRGPGGGYTLARLASEITLRDILEAVEGPIALFGSGSEGEDSEEGAELPTDSLGARGPDFIWPELTQQLSEVLEETTIDDLCRQAARDGIRRAAIEGYEYQI
ncbi:MAG: Rrf2 family transcriptional regulator [Myxococcota bacterium]|nr:Rrf2 family transcriptional regulator [Myxococcota bacterium]